jgi:hypothetical protein
MNDMENRDEELQHNIERSLVSGSDKDTRAYRLVFEALRQEPEFRLSSKFSDSVLQRMETAEGRSQYYWFAFVILGFVVAAGVAIALTDFRPDFGFLKHISKFTGLFVFGAAFVVLLQWVDKKLLTGKSARI